MTVMAKSRKECQEYKLVSVLNMFCAIPGWCYPIFEKDGKHYFEDGASSQIRSFTEYRGELPKKWTTPMKNISDSFQNPFKIGSNTVYAIQLTVNEFVVTDNKEKFIARLKDFDSEGKWVFIQNFLDEN